MRPENLVYTLSLIFFIAWWIISGVKRRQDLLSWIAACGLIILLVITGTEIQLFIELLFSVPQPCNCLHAGSAGAVFFGILGVILLRKIFGWSENIFEIIGIPFFISAAIIFVGCFYEGNCFGSVSSLPWAITYDKGTAVHTWQVTSAVIDFTSEKSLPVHPVQFYNAIACLLAAVFFFVARNKFHIKGIKLFSFSIMIFLVCLFIFSFCEQQLILDKQNLLKPDQYLLLGGIIFFALFSRIQAGIPVTKAKTKKMKEVGKAVAIAYCMSGTLVMFFATWTDMLVVVLIQAALLTVLVVERIRTLKWKHPEKLVVPDETDTFSGREVNVTG